MNWMANYKKIVFQDSEMNVEGWELDSVLEIELSNSKKAYIIDGVFDAESASTLFKNYSKFPFQFTDFDRDDTKHVQHLVHYLSDEQISDPNGAGSIINLVYDLLDGFKLKHKRKISRSYINFNLFGDFQYNHSDGDEWTALFFIADEWNEDWMGEFFIVDPIDSVKFAVTPKPGRMVLFDGEIIHRGGVPSKLCFKPRLTLAVKVER
jgi:SM-20-related protein